MDDVFKGLSEAAGSAAANLSEAAGSAGLSEAADKAAANFSEAADKAAASLSQAAAGSNAATGPGPSAAGLGAMSGSTAAAAALGAIGSLSTSGSSGSAAVGTGMKRFDSLIEPMIIFIKGIAKKIKFIMDNWKPYLITIAVLLVALIVIAIIFVMAVLAVILMYYRHPRPGFINRYSNADSFRTKFYADIDRCMRAVSNGTPVQVASAAEVTHGASRFINSPDFLKNLDIYMRYSDTIANAKKKGFFSVTSSQTFANADIFMKGSDATGKEFSMPLMLKYEADFSNPFTRYREAVRRLATTLRHAAVGYDLPSDQYSFIAAALELDLLLNEYMPRALDIFSMRREKVVPAEDDKRANSSKKMDLLLWERYYVPFVNGMYVNAVKKSILTWHKTFLKIFVKMDEFWLEVGMFIARIPCMASPDFKHKCSTVNLGIKIGKTAERFTQGMRRRDEDDDERLPAKLRHYDAPGEGDARDGEDVIENFGALFSLARAVGSFFKNFAPLGLQFIKYFKDFPKSPMKSIFGLVMLILAPTIGVVLLWIYAIFSIGLPVSVIWLVIAATAFTIATLYAVVYLVGVTFITLSLFFVFLGVWIVDQMFGGIVVQLMQCEEDPDAMETRRNFAEGNVFTRMALVCVYPCFRGYVPTRFPWFGESKITCKRQEESRPDVCPQQQLLRMFRGKPMMKPYMYDEFKPSMTFRFRSASAKKQIIKDTFKERNRFLLTCSRSLNQPLGAISRHVCSNVGNIKFTSITERNAVLKMCSQIFCQGVDKKVPRDAGVCNYLKATAGDTDVTPGMDPSSILSTAMVVTIAAVVVLLAAMALVRASGKRASAMGVSFVKF